jgi:hypothetical protein
MAKPSTLQILELARKLAANNEGGTRIDPPLLKKPAPFAAGCEFLFINTQRVVQQEFALDGRLTIGFDSPRKVRLGSISGR